MLDKITVTQQIDIVLYLARHKSRKERRALMACVCARNIPSPLVYNIPEGKYILWMGRNTAYRMLRDAGYWYHEKSGTWQLTYKVWRA